MAPYRGTLGNYGTGGTVTPPVDPGTGTRVETGSEQYVRVTNSQVPGTVMDPSLVPTGFSSGLTWVDGTEQRYSLFRTSGEVFTRSLVDPTSEDNLVFEFLFTPLNT